MRLLTGLRWNRPRQWLRKIRSTTKCSDLSVRGSHQRDRGAPRKISRMAMTVSKERSINGLPQQDIEKISCFTTFLASTSRNKRYFSPHVLGNGDRGRISAAADSCKQENAACNKKRKLPVQSCRARILGIWFNPPRRRRRKTGTNDVRADQRCPAAAKPIRMIFSSVR